MRSAKRKDRFSLNIKITQWIIMKLNTPVNSNLIDIAKSLSNYTSSFAGLIKFT